MTTKRKKCISVWLQAETVDVLTEVAEDADIPRSKVAALLLEEMLPTVSGVRMRLQITRVSERTPKSRIGEERET